MANGRQPRLSASRSTLEPDYGRFGTCAERPSVLLFYPHRCIRRYSRSIPCAMPLKLDEWRKRSGYRESRSSTSVEASRNFRPHQRREPPSSDLSTSWLNLSRALKVPSFSAIRHDFQTGSLTLHGIAKFPWRYSFAIQTSKLVAATCLYVRSIGTILTRSRPSLAPWRTRSRQHHGLGICGPLRLTFSLLPMTRRARSARSPSLATRPPSSEPTFLPQSEPPCESPY